MNGKLVSVYTVVHEFRGKDEVPKRLLEVFDEFLSRRKKLEGKDFSYSTLCKLSQARQHTGNVLKSKGVSDLDLSQLKITFLHDFIHVLRSNEYATSTINRAIRDLKQVIKYAISRGYLDKDPFVGYRLKHEKKPINYLTGEELQSIVNWVPVSDKLSNVRDCFVFSCYSGLDYSSSKALRLHHINTLPDGTRWIEMVRQKTNKSIRVPLLPEAEKIVDKYIIAPESKLPLYSNQKFNVYLKEIGAALGIRTKLTHHLARKTFATTVLLSRGVPIEVVKELLGHSDIATTMSSYATVNRGLIMDHLNKLR